MTDTTAAVVLAEPQKALVLPVLLAGGEGAMSFCWSSFLCGSRASAVCAQPRDEIGISVNGVSIKSCERQGPRDRPSAKWQIRHEGNWSSRVAVPT